MWQWLSGWNPEAVIALAALFVAGGALVAARRAHRASYQPILRIVPLWYGSNRQFLDDNEIVLKNIGRGTAMSIVIVAGRGHKPDALVGEVDALEPLGELYGPDFQECGRVGRRVVDINPPLQIGGFYRVLYQDTASHWHESTFDVRKDAFVVRVLGAQQPEDIPRWVLDRAQVVRGI